MGSVHFMSPEQGAGDVLDGRSDLYSLGTVGFLALSGQLPFAHDQASAILVQRATRDAPSLRTVATDVPAPIADVIARCLARNPDDRPATGEALAELLEQALRDAVALDEISRPQRALSETQANLVWRRAAQRHAEAAARLEARTRELQGGTAATPARAPANNGGDPTSGYRVSQVQAAAEEAGISRQFVALAIAELQADSQSGRALVARAEEPSPVVRTLLGRTPRTISVTRTFDRPMREVLHALGAALRRPPAGLNFRETIGGHALQGGVLVFDLPGVESYAATGGDGLTYGNYLWNWTRYQLWVKTVRAQLTAVPGNSSRCEVTLTIEPAEGHTGSIWESLGFGAGGAGAGGLAGVVMTKKAVVEALLGMHASIPLMVGGVVLGMLGNRLLYQYALRESRVELEKALTEVSREFTHAQVFGDPFGEPLAAPRAPRLPSG
jgi:hypothetical protein